MSSTLRIAVPESLRMAVEAARRTLPFEIVAAAAPTDPGRQLRWQRLWGERRRAAPSTASDAALQDPSVCALLLLLDRQVDAALLSEADSGCGPAWDRLEPAAAASAPVPTVCADLWIGSLNWEFGWLDWPGTGELSHGVEQLRSAAAAFAGAAGGPTVPLVVNFAGGRNPLQPQVERFLATLRARTPMASIELYSPLFFSGGSLDAAALLARLRQASGSAHTVLCAPQLARPEFAAALAAAGGQWAGPLRAGAEAPAARLAPDDAPARFEATLAWLARLARAPR